MNQRQLKKLTDLFNNRAEEYKQSSDVWGVVGLIFGIITFGMLIAFTVSFTI